MTQLSYNQDGYLWLESVRLDALAAQFGTPCYVYSRAALEQQWRAFDTALQSHPHLVCFAVKANANLAILNCLARLGSGFDIVSVGELERVLAAGGEPSKVIFSGVGKRHDELVRALAVGIGCFNIESAAELERLSAIAVDQHCQAPIAIRVNPDVDAKTHPYIATGLAENKFGVDIPSALALYHHAATLPGLRVIGIDCHIGSQLTTLSPIVDALERVLQLANQLRRDGIALQQIDMGGGLGIRYCQEQPPDPTSYAQALLTSLSQHDYKLIIEPGRAIVGNAGILLTRIEYIKQHHQGRAFAIVDAGMNDLVRPTLYQAVQEIKPVYKRSGSLMEYDIVGPVCETGDFLGKQRSLTVQPQDLLAVCSSGAYGFTMSSNYNSRPRPPEIMVDGQQIYEIRPRESVQSLFATEQLLP
jgi:diaminopimelate decarboxylase